MSRSQSELAFAAVFVAFLSWIAWEARDWDFRAQLFPLAVALPLLALALLQLGVASWRLFAERASASPNNGVGAEGGTVRRGLVVAAWIVGFAAIIWLLGFAIGSAFASLTYLRFAATERWRTAIIYAVLVYVCIAAGFDYALGITFPPGVIQSALIPMIRGT